jgi:hypothetical protein
VLFHAAGGVHFTPATLSPSKTTEQIKKKEHDRMPQLWDDLLAGGEVPARLSADNADEGSACPALKQVAGDRKSDFMRC